MYQYLLDDDWIVAIQAEIDEQPETLADIVEPELVGRFDAEQRNPCEPLRYFAKLGDIEQYVNGYKASTLLMEQLDAEREFHETENELIDDVRFAMLGAW